MWKKLVAAVCVLFAVGAVAVALTGEQPVVVERVVDGDTIVVKRDGESVRVRLLNIDTPEIGRDGRLDECFAQEAKQRLEELLPDGTTVSLEYDVERQDRYGRDLAGVFEGTTFINEVLAKEGLARAVVFEPNRKFYDRIAAAEAGPRAGGDGIFGASGTCFYPDAVMRERAEQLENFSADVEKLDLDSPRNLERGRTLIRGIDDNASALRHHIAAQDLFFAEEANTQLDDQQSKADDARKRLDATEVKERRRLEQEREKRELEEAQRREREREELRDTHRDAQPIEAPSAAQPPQSNGASGGAGDTYTGCRAYGGNYALNNTDDKGRPYAKIDCVTKRQIG